MNNFNLKPSEESYEIELTGSFIPSKFHPMWFYKNGLLGEIEAKNADLVEAGEEELLFSTKFITITVEKDKFVIATKQMFSFDLVKDMAIGVSEILKDSIKNIFSIGIQLHFTFSNKKKYLHTLNKLFEIEKWKSYLTNPQAHSFRIIDEIKSENTQLERTITVFPCTRGDMQNTLHLYVFNIFEIKKKELSVSNIVKDDNTTLKESFDIINKIIDLNFKKN